MTISYNPIPNGYTALNAITFDETLRKVITGLPDGSVKWIGNANNPAIATEDLSWNADGTVTIRVLNPVTPSNFTATGNVYVGTADGSEFGSNKGISIKNTLAYPNGYVGLRIENTGTAPSDSVARIVMIAGIQSNPYQWSMRVDTDNTFVIHEDGLASNPSTPDINRLTIAPTTGLSTFSGDVTITKTAPVLTLNGVGVTSAGLQFTTNSLNRWLVTVPTGSTNLRFNDGTSDRLILANGGVIMFNTTVSTGASGGDPVIPNAGTYRAANAAGSNTVGIASVDSNNNIHFNTDASPHVVAIGNVSNANTNAANNGDVVIANNANLSGVNQAASTVRKIIRLNTSNVVELAADGDDIRWGRANIALGGGATPTFGTIGGSGPAAAAQRNWLRVIESDGTASFIPVWR